MIAMTEVFLREADYQVRTAAIDGCSGRRRLAGGGRCPAAPGVSGSISRSSFNRDDSSADTAGAQADGALQEGGGTTTGPACSRQQGPCEKARLHRCRCDCSSRTDWREGGSLIRELASSRCRLSGSRSIHYFCCLRGCRAVASGAGTERSSQCRGRRGTRAHSGIGLA